jgi:hypothetical protein
MIKITIIIDQPRPDKEKLPAIVDAIKRFVYLQFLDLNTRMSSPIRIFVETVSEGEGEEGILL